MCFMATNLLTPTLFRGSWWVPGPHSSSCQIGFQDHRLDSNKGKKNKIYEHLKKEIENKSKKVVTKEDVRNQVFFVDKARNAAVVIGDKDLKAEVKSRRNRERWWSLVSLEEKSIWFQNSGSCGGGGGVWLSHLPQPGSVRAEVGLGRCRHRVPGPGHQVGAGGRDLVHHAVQVSHQVSHH